MRIRITIILALFSFHLTAQNQIEQEEDTSYILVSPARKMPKYKHGTNKEFVQKIYSSLKYPSHQCLEGTTVLAYVVNEKGQVEDAKIMRSISDSIDKQLLRMIYEFEFIPGEFQGKVVSMKMNLPIRVGLK